MLDFKKINTLSDFRKIIGKSATFNNPVDKLDYFNKIKTDLEFLIKSEGGIKLLSSKESKYYLQALTEVESKIRNLLIEIKRLKKVGKDIADNIISVDNAKTEKDYIKWIDSRDRLEVLLRTLIEYHYILENPSKINSIIKGHFFIENYSDNKNTNITKIRWGKSQPLIIYLFEKLFNKNLIDYNLYISRFALIEKHFIQKSNKPFNNKTLAKSNNQAGNKPNGYEMLDDYIEYVIEETKPIE